METLEYHVISEITFIGEYVTNGLMIPPDPSFPFESTFDSTSKNLKKNIIIFKPPPPKSPKKHLFSEET